MLTEDPKLPFLDMAWSPRQMAVLLNTRVMPRFDRAREVTHVSIEDMTYKPSRQCVILYAIRFGDAPGDPCQWVVGTFAKDNKLQELYSECSRDAAGSPGATGSGFATFLPEYRCLVEFFPTDWKLPCLAQAINGDERAAETDVLQYRPHERCVVRYAPGSVDGQISQHMIGKFYPKGPKAARAWHAQNSVYEQATADVLIPKPLGLSRDRSSVLMECVQGTPMKQVLEERAPALGSDREAVRRIARALASLHRMSYQSEEVRTVENQLELFRERAADLHLVAPRLADQVDALLDRIATTALRFKSDLLSCIHGECKASQFLMMKDGQVAVVDFDRVCLGDPAVDVGNFMAGMHREAVEGHLHFRDLASRFLADYQERSPGNGLVERARLFQAASLVRMAVRAFTRTPHAYGYGGAESLPVRLLEEAEACLVGQ